MATSITSSALKSASTGADDALSNIWGGILPPEYSLEAKKLSEMGLPQTQWLDYLVSKGIPAPLAMLVKLNAATQAKAAAGAPVQPPQGTVMDKVISQAQQKAAEERARLADVIQQTSADQSRQGGVASLPVPSTMFGNPGAPQTVGMARGGIVAFSEGGGSGEYDDGDSDTRSQDILFAPQGQGGGDASIGSLIPGLAGTTDYSLAHSNENKGLTTFGSLTGINAAPQKPPATSSGEYDSANDPNPDLTNTMYTQFVRPTTSGTGIDLSSLSKGAADMHQLVEYAKNNIGALPSREASDAAVEVQMRAAGIGKEDERYQQKIQDLMDVAQSRAGKQNSLLAAQALFSGAANLLRPGQGGNPLSQTLRALTETGAEYSKGRAELDQKQLEAQQALELARHNVLNHSEAVRLGMIDEENKYYRNSVTDYNDRLRDWVNASKAEIEYGGRSVDTKLKAAELALAKNPAFDLIQPQMAAQNAAAQYYAAGDTARGDAAMNAGRMIRDNARQIITSSYPAAVVTKIKDDNLDKLQAGKDAYGLSMQELKNLENVNSMENQISSRLAFITDPDLRAQLQGQLDAARAQKQAILSGRGGVNAGAAGVRTFNPATGTFQ
jgi:hypothetical protein